MDVLKLFRGEVEPSVVQASADDDRHGLKAKHSPNFYGYLYLGLFYHSQEQPALSRSWLEKCLEQKTGGYMADVAQVHLKLFP